jgi:hypothetical protein
MKKITLAIAVLFIGLQAQSFSAPYCELGEAEDISVEEITSVAFTDTTIANADTESVLIDETTTIATVNQDGTYTIEVAGNTYGNFDTDIVAFIDWNQNDILDDEGEIYAVGTLVNSDGNDGVLVSLANTVPADAVIGTTRIRLTKKPIKMHNLLQK